MIWNDVWQKKAAILNNNIREINGWEETKCDASVVYNTIKEQLCLSEESSILEIGCGAGYLSKEFIEKKHTFEGIDKSDNMIFVAKNIYPFINFNISEANVLKYEDNHFDYVIMFSVAQYFNDHKYFYEVVKEMKRVAKKGIYIGDLVQTSKRKEHLKFDKELFKKPWQISNGIYVPERFNIFLKNNE